MGFQGFDSEQISILAADLRGRGDGAPGLHNDLRHVLSDAQELLEGATPVTVNPDLEKLVGVSGIIDGLFGYSHLPGSLGGDLTTTADEMDRRRRQLDGCIGLQEQGYPVDSAMVFADEDPPSQKDIDDAVDAVKHPEGRDLDWLGNRGDLQALAERLKGLSSVELDAVVARLSDEDLRRLNDLMSDESSFWSNNGLPRAERFNLVGDMMARVSQGNLDRLTQAFPWAQPGFTSTDTYLDGENSQSGETSEGMHWETPTDPLFKPNENGDLISADDIAQGGFADCWYIASMTAIAQRNPDFLREGIRQNPNGTVSVRVWDQEGNMRWVTVTSDLPTKENGEPVSAYGVDGETWPAYYEKAFALTYSEDDGGTPPEHPGDPRYDRTEQGNYGAIEWDYNEKAPPYLTGNDTEDVGDLFHSDFDSVRNAFESGHPVIVSTPPEGGDQPWGEAYVTRHVYYVQGFTDDGKIKLGNPWGPDSPTIECTPEEFEEYFENPQKITIPE